MTLIPEGASVTPLGRKLAELDAPEAPSDWYARAAGVLRGGDGGEHGLLLYKLTASLAERGHPPVVLDVGTARGFSAIAMARAMMDAGLSGRVYTVDVVGHHEPVGWHSAKHDLGDPLAGVEMARSEIWDRWFPDEAAWVSLITGRSTDVLDGWRHGPIGLAFLDGSHAYEDVKGELAALDPLMAEHGTIVLDDYHPGVAAVRVRSRLLNAAAWAVGAVLGKAWPPAGRLSPRLGDGNEFALVRRRFHGVRKAVAEFLEERPGRWRLDIVSMPSRGEYQGDDYSLAVLGRAADGAPSSQPSPAGEGADSQERGHLE